MTYATYFSSLSQEELNEVLSNLQKRMEELQRQERSLDYESLRKVHEIAFNELSNRTTIFQIG